MTSSELRIGNYVTDGYYDTFKTVIEVESINEKGINLLIEDDGRWAEISDRWIEPEYRFDLLFGIPLTKEWLLKFGFDFSIDTWYLKGVAIWETECCDAKGNEEIGFFYELRDVGMMDMNIKYVHQLQNLYFSLTGEELKIK